VCKITFRYVLTKWQVNVRIELTSRNFFADNLVNEVIWELSGFIKALTEHAVTTGVLWHAPPPHPQKFLKLAVKALNLEENLIKRK